MKISILPRVTPRNTLFNAEANNRKNNINLSNTLKTDTVTFGGNKVSDEMLDDYLELLADYRKLNDSENEKGQEEHLPVSAEGYRRRMRLELEMSKILTSARQKDIDYKTFNKELVQRAFGRDPSLKKLYLDSYEKAYNRNDGVNSSGFLDSASDRANQDVINYLAYGCIEKRLF